MGLSPLIAREIAFDAFGEVDAPVGRDPAALLDKLAEYKKSLIFECVTGKREVPSCWNR